MVILEIDVYGGFVVPAEGDPVISCHPHRPSFRFALQAVEVKTGDVQLLRMTCDFQQLQDANALPDMIGANPAGCAGEVNLFKSLVPEPVDHSCSVDYLVYSVKHLPPAVGLAAFGVGNEGGWFPALRKEREEWGTRQPAAEG